MKAARKETIGESALHDAKLLSGYTKYILEELEGGGTDRDRHLNVIRLLKIIDSISRGMTWYITKHLQEEDIAKHE